MNPNPHRGHAGTPTVVRVRASSGAYDAVVGAGVLGHVGDAALRAGGGRGSGRAMVAHDDALPRSVVDLVGSSLHSAGFGSIAMVAVHASEARKSLDSLRDVLVELARSRHERDDPLIALGGGVVGDLAGFAGAVYRRGVPVIQCPTTLLAMVDASVGGKTAVNLELSPGDLKKNLVGAFHQPAAVLADTDTLASLPERHFRAGLAECIKHAMIGGECGDPGLLDDTERALDAVLRREPGPLGGLIARNIAVKAKVVEVDEFERAADSAGGRALLNLGHTFAHAIEPLPVLSPDGDPAHAPLHHGEAVGLGLLAACRCAERLGLVDATYAARIASLLARAGLPARITGLPASQDVVALMAHDKKSRSGRVRLVLPAGPGRAKVVADPPMAPVLAAIDSIRR